MVYGMTIEQFWDGEPILAKYYREAYEFRKEEENKAAWMQGLYFRDAVAQVLLGNKKAPYPFDPYPLNTKRSQQQYQKRKQAIERENMFLEREKFLAWARKNNERLLQKEAAKKAAQVHKGGEPQ